MSNIDKQTLTLKERIEKALSDFTKGRASMHVPPLDTDVDMVLADCLTALGKLEATAAQANAGWKEAHEQEARAEAAEKRIADYQELISGLVGVSSSILREVERINKAAGTAKGE